MAAAKKFSAGVSGEQRFLLKALGFSSAAPVLPAGFGKFGLRAGYAGDLNLNETGLGLAYAGNAGNKIAFNSIILA